MRASQQVPDSGKSKILIVDDDEVFAEVLARSFDRRGYTTRVAANLDTAVDAVTRYGPNFAVVDLNLQGSSGLKVVRRLREVAPCTGVVVLTAFGSIATTVDAIKLGAVSYLTKPANADEVLAALHGDDRQSTDPERAEVMSSISRLEWEHIHRVLFEYKGNISLSARVLGIHRRTLQRKLGKHPVPR